MYVKVNPNPCGSYVGDCVIRAISIATGKSWQEVFIDVCIEGFILCDMPSSNRVWGNYLKSLGYKSHIIPQTCCDSYSIRDFCGEYFKGTYIVCTGTHAVCVRDGIAYDSWNSLDEQPIYYWSKEEE